MQAGLVIRSGLLWIGVALIALYWPVSMLVPNAVLGDILRAVQVAASLIVIAAYAPCGIAGLWRGKPDRVEQLSLGITLGFVALLGNGAWFLVWRLADRPPWMPDSWVNHFTLWLAVFASALYISAASAVKVAPSRAALLAAAAFGAGVVFTVVVFAIAPDLRVSVEGMRPYLHR